jgi:hypothetical protein
VVCDLLSLSRQCPDQEQEYKPKTQLQGAEIMAVVERVGEQAGRSSLFRMEIDQPQKIKSAGISNAPALIGIGLLASATCERFATCCVVDGQLQPQQVHQRRWNIHNTGDDE